MDSGITQFNVNSSSSFPSSSSTPCWRFDVFLSFRGEDTRKNFTDHLYTALVQSGINTFRDDDELPRGHEISLELLKAIEESRISIVIFSKNYGSSRWCLDELVKIMDCRKTIRQLVLPVFYDVDPSDVRKQKGTFADAFAKHEERYGAETQKLKAWRSVLTEAADLSGWDLQNVANGYEAKFIKKIVERVVREVNRTQLHVAKYPVGLDYHVNQLNSLLSGRTSDVCFLGIYGMGGIGKTTIAKYYYNSVFCQYQVSCFLANVREESQQHNGLVHLQEQLLSEILMKRKESIANVDAGIRMLEQRLCSRRVLIVLDDLDQLHQLASLAGDRRWFAKGSLVIITTRNEHVLDHAEVDVKYEVKELSSKESVTLFSYHAFKEPVPTQSYKGVLEDIVRYAGGLPLALEVLGSSLFKKSMAEWKSMLGKLKVIPNNEIQAKLKISFEALDDDTVKDIFLDIACFFVGMDKDHAIKIFDACRFFGDIGISILVNRSLLKISPCCNMLVMHDLIRDMGRGIIRERFPKEPGRHTRLWRHDDVVDVLSNDKGTEAIEGIKLDLLQQQHFSTKPFSRMPNLRLLEINNVNLDGSFTGLFEQLRWLCWHSCPLESLPLDFHLGKLVCLEMKRSNLTTLWSGTKFLGNLKEMDLRESEFLTTTPNFSGVRNLEKLSLDRCRSLSNIDTSIGLLDKLKTLSLGSCEDLRCLPKTIGDLTSLEYLNVVWCSNLEGLPEMSGDMECLTTIEASYSGIKELPDSIGNLRQLRELWVNNCRRIESLPNSISNLRSLERLCLSECSNLELLPEQIGNLQCLKSLNADGTAIKQIPLSIGLLHNLKYLELALSKSDISHTGLVWLWNLKCLSILSLIDCNLSDEDIQDDLQGLSSLTQLNLSGNNFCSLPSSIAQLSHLEKLVLAGCRLLQSVLELPSSLETFDASDCTSLKKLPNLSNLKCLKDIELRNCSSLAEIQGLENLNSVKEIDIEGCSFSLSTTTIENFLIQGPSEKDFRELRLSSRDIQDCFEYQGMEGSTISFDVPLCVPKLSFCATIWLDCDVNDDGIFIVNIDNKTNDEGEWTCYIARHHGVNTRCSSLIQVPQSLKIKTGDCIEVSFKTENSISKLGKCGVHLALASSEDCLLLLPDKPIKDGVHQKRSIDFEEVETGYNAFKRLKQSQK